MKTVGIVVLMITCLLAGAASAEEAALPAWAERVALSGAIEVEASHVDTEGATVDDIVTSTAAFGADVAIHELVAGHILFLWEEGATEPVDIDEAAITIGGTEEMPFFLTAGRHYLPFGAFPSAMLTDPLTVEIGEIRQSALAVGYRNETFSATLAAFNGDVVEAGGEEDAIDGFAASLAATAPEGALGQVSIEGGVSWLGNIGETYLENYLGAVEGKVPGVSAYALAGYGMFTLATEYVGATGSFEAGELSFAVDGDGATVEARPAAWFAELTASPVEKLIFALRYEGSSDLFLQYPESRVGATVGYEIFPYTTVSAEYARGSYDGGMDEDALTAKLAMKF